MLSPSSHMAYRRGYSFHCFTDEQIGAQRRQLTHARLLSQKVSSQVVLTTWSCKNPHSLTAMSWNSDSLLPHERLNGQYPISTGEGFKTPRIYSLQKDLWSTYCARHGLPASYSHEPKKVPAFLELIKLWGEADKKQVNQKITRIIRGCVSVIKTTDR